MLGSAIDKPARARALRMMNHLLAVWGEQAAVFEILDFLWGFFSVRLKPSFPYYCAIVRYDLKSSLFHRKPLGNIM